MKGLEVNSYILQLWLTSHLITVGLATGWGGTQKLGSLGLPLSVWLTLPPVQRCLCSYNCGLTGFLISVGLASGVRVGTQKLGSLGLPFSVPSLEPSLAGLEEEEELATLELVVASLATLLMLGAMEWVLGWKEEGGSKVAKWISLDCTNLTNRSLIKGPTVTISSIQQFFNPEGSTCTSGQYNNSTVLAWRRVFEIKTL